MTMKLPRGWRRIAHFKPYRFNNSPAGIRAAKRRRYSQIDQDTNLTDGDVNAPNRSQRPVPVVAHWSLVRKDGFNYMVVAVRRVKRRGKKNLPYVLVRGKWQRAYWAKGSKEWITVHPYGRDARWSSLTWPQARGLRTRSGQRVHTLLTHLRVAKAVNIRLAIEVKGDHRFGYARVAQDMFEDVTTARMVGKVILMTLQNIGQWWPRLRAMHAAGFTTVLLVRNAKPANFDTVHARYTDYLRGTWRATRAGAMFEPTDEPEIAEDPTDLRLTEPAATAGPRQADYEAPEDASDDSEADYAAAEAALLAEIATEFDAEQYEDEESGEVRG